MEETVVPIGLPPQVHTEVQLAHKEVIMVVMEAQVREDSMALVKEVSPAGHIGVTEDSLMEGLTDTMLLQVTFLLVLAQKRTSGSRLLTWTTAASSA